MKAKLTNRYQSQIALPEVGSAGQEAIAQGSVLCVGAGGLGCPALLYLAAAGVGRIGVIDHDSVDVSNLQRQVLFETSWVGRNKAEAAATRLRALNPEIEIQPYPFALTIENVLETLSGYDVVIDGTDNFTAKFLINDAAAKLGIPVVYGSVSGFEGRVSVFWASKGPCYRCLQPGPPVSPVTGCAESGVLGPVAGMTGSMQALEAVKLLLKLPPLIGRLAVLDAAAASLNSFTVRKNLSCELCSIDPDLIMLREEAPAVCLTQRVITPEELDAHREGAQLVDVRELHEWNEGHIPAALHWPLGRMERGEFPALTQDTKSFIFYCRSGIRSARALELFLAKNPNGLACHLTGGFIAWSAQA